MWTPSQPNNTFETATGGGNVASSGAGQEYIDELDLYKPNEIVNKVFKRHKSALGFRFMLGSAAKSQGVSQPTVGHYESGLEEDVIKVGAKSGSGAGADVVVTLDADNMYNVAGLGQSSYPRKRDLIMFGNGMKAWVKDKDESVNPHTITVRPIKSADNLTTAVTVGSSYAIIGNAHGEGTGLPATIHPRYWKYTSEFQIIKEAMSYSGSALSNSIRLTTDATNPDSPYLLEILDDTLMRYELASDRTLLFSDTIDNITTTSDILSRTVNVKGTKGLDTFAQDYGHDYTYTPTSWAISDFKSTAEIYEDERIGINNIHGMVGFGFYGELEDVGVNFLGTDGNAATFTRAVGTMYNSGLADRVDMDNEELYGFGIEIGFRAITKLGYTFSWQKLTEFNNKTSVGGDAYNYKQRAIWCPIGHVGQLGMDGQRSSHDAPTMFYNYKKAGNYSRERQYGIVNGVGSASIMGVAGIQGLLRSNGLDGSQFGVVSEINFHAALPNGFVYVQPA